MAVLRVELLFLLLTVAKSAIAQHTIGLAEIRNFSHEATKGGTQNWQLVQSANGVMYFANNAGLLTYNGSEWKLFSLPNKTMVRSLALGPEGRIYVGGQDEIGYFLPNTAGSLQYHSLLPLIPQEHHSFGDVWNIIVMGKSIFCRTSQKIFQLPTSTIRSATVFVSPKESRWAFMGRSGQQLIAQNGIQNLVVLTNNKWQQVDAPLLNNTLVTASIPFSEQETLITTMRNGLFLLSGNSVKPYVIPSFVTESSIYTAINLPNQEIAIGTVNNGIFIINREGKITRQYSIENGLQNNNIRGLFIDASKNLWAGLDEGVALIPFSSAIHRISPNIKGRIATYASLVYNNQLLIGTSDGLYAAAIDTLTTPDLSQSQSIFTKVPNADGQVWSLKEFDKKVLIGHHDGAFEYVQHNANSITRMGGGYWLFRSINNNTKYIAGTYQGIRELTVINNKIYPDSSFIYQLRETLRFVEVDPQTRSIWASHPNRGIYRFSMSADYRTILDVSLFTEKNGLPSNKDNYVFKVNNEIVFCTQNGIVQFDESKKYFVPNPAYQKLFGDLSIRFLTQDAQKRVWFATDKTVGFAENGQLKQINELENLLVQGFEHIYPFNDQNIFIGSANGIIHLNLENYLQKKPLLQVSFNKISAGSNNDTLMFGGFYLSHEDTISGQSMMPKLSADINSFHFEFTSNQFAPHKKVVYSYKLEGFDKEWSAWSEKAEKDYTNIPYGKYQFLLKGRDADNSESPIAVYSFEVLPHWYQTWWAKLFYMISIGITAMALAKYHKHSIKLQQERFEKEEAQLKYMHELELEHSEREIIKLQKEQLEADMLYKNKELAATTLHLYKRGKLLSKIKEDLSQATKSLEDAFEKKEFVKVLKLITEEEKKDGDWTQFAIHFDAVHNKFLHRLKSAYPVLTQTDLKMCAYIKMNLSTKEIAQLMNITIKGVEVSKYRLKKKINIQQEESLINFINEFS